MIVIYLTLIWEELKKKAYGENYMWGNKRSRTDEKADFSW